MAGPLPSVQDVADLVRARTRDDVGQEVGTFTEATRPTGEAVERLIAQEAALVGLRTGNLDALACPDTASVHLGIATVIAKRVAAIIEASYRPDELAEGRTVADFYEGSQEDDLAAAEAAAAACRAWTSDDEDAGTDAKSPVGFFPPAFQLGRW